MINTFDIDKNFWIEHPDMKVVEPFKSIYDSDKTKKKLDSSLMMWFIVLCYDRESKYCKLTADGEDGKHSIVGEDYCGDILYYKKWKLILDPAIEMYIKLQYSPMERHMKTWEDYLDDRTAIIKEKSKERDLATFKELDLMAVGTDKVYKTIKTIIDDMAKEASEGSVKGGGDESLGDR